MSALPATLTMKERESFRLTITAENRGPTTLDTERDDLQLYIDGERSLNFALNWQNGLRTRKWEALPPGEKVSEARGFGTSFFLRPGSFELVLKKASAPVARARVEVTP